MYAGRGFVAGWRMPVVFSDQVRHIDVLVDRDFPRAPVRIALVDRPAFLTWPHVERDGLLCLLPNSAQVDSSSALEALKNQVGSASELVEDCVAGRNEDDFRDEFESYWASGASAGRSTYSLVRPDGPTRLVRVWHGKDFDLIGEAEDAMHAWLRHRFGPALTKKQLTTDSAVFIWLAQPLVPREFPQTGADVRSLIEEHAPEICSALDDLAFKGSKRISALVASPTKNGTCLGRLTISPSVAPLLPGHRRRGDSVANGFRPNKVPMQIVRQRVFGSNPLARTSVGRADAAWVHGRGVDPRADRLRTMTVGILGAGAVGSGVAGLLARAGVGRLVIVDPDVLSWANVGRHALGASFVGQNKARALSRHILSELPHIRGVEPHARHWQALADSAPQVLEQCDLLISTMADWASESALNAWHLERSRERPILYGWLEPHACAGHSVIVAGSGGCLQCGFSPVGLPRLRVVDWQETPQKQEPACGAVFQPYGPTELAHVVSLVAETAVDSLLQPIAGSTHRIWAARAPLVRSLGGRWTAEWTAGSGDADRGGLIDERPWSQDSECPDCGSSGR